jgi:hypothetical protein
MTSKDSRKWGNPQPLFKVPVSEVEYTIGVCKVKGCNNFGDLGNGYCVTCWDRKGIKNDI